MLDKLKKAAVSCFKPKTRGDGNDASSSEGQTSTSTSGAGPVAGPSSSAAEYSHHSFYGDVYPSDDPLLWSRDFERHFLGDLSCAIMQSNNPIEDYSLIEIGEEATFAGIFDGHGGPEAARYTAEHLFPNLMTHAKEKGEIDEEVVESAIALTEAGFLDLSYRTHFLRKEIAAAGTCVVMAVIWNRTLIVANLGDSRAVLASFANNPNRIVAEQLTDEHNASMQKVRDQLRKDHPDNPNIVSYRNGAWRVKGLIQISRSIGDMYLKREGYHFDATTHPRFHCSPITRPVLSAEPSIATRALEPNHRFLILASDGLWEHFENQEAVDFVANNPRQGIAKRLVMVAMEKIAKGLKAKCEDLWNVGKGARRACHDDISVVVVFFNKLTDGASSSSAAVSSHQSLCIRGHDDNLGTSHFHLMNSKQDEDEDQDQ